MASCLWWHGTVGDRYGTGTIEGNTTPSPVPYHQTQLATFSCPQYSSRAFKRKIITWSNLKEWVWMRSVWGNACRAIVRVRIPGYGLKNKRNDKFITSYAFLPSDTDSTRRGTNKQTHKQTPNERAWKLRALRYAFLPWWPRQKKSIGML